MEAFDEHPHKHDGLGVLDQRLETLADNRLTHKPTTHTKVGPTVTNPAGQITPSAAEVEPNHSKSNLGQTPPPPRHSL